MEEAKAITEDLSNTANDHTNTTTAPLDGSNNNNNNDQGELAGANTGCKC
ncbi:18105_t:CDS:2 [Entrophospora sp. SA101]|nr:18105_t:CDS:2 [Entrophospora sp. SA101]